MRVDQAKLDVEAGCEGAVQAMFDWIKAVETENIDLLEDILDDRYRMTCAPFANNGSFTKAEFIELDRHIRDSKKHVLSLVARKCENVVVLQFFMHSDERMVGNLGPNMPSADFINAQIVSSPMAYVVMWKADAEGRWRCVQNHVFGPVGQYGDTSRFVT